MDGGFIVRAGEDEGEREVVEERKREASCALRGSWTGLIACVWWLIYDI